MYMFGCIFMLTSFQDTDSKEVRPNKNAVFTITCLEKNGSVDRNFILLYFSYVFQPKQLKCTFWLSLCFTSINFMFKKDEGC